MKKRTSIIVGGIVLLVAVIVVGLQLRDDSAQHPISFAYQPFGNNLPFFVAVEKGFFKERGLDVEPVKIISANDAANAVVRGDVVGDATVPLNVVLNIEENAAGQFRIFMVKTTSKQRWSDYLLVRKGSDIDSVAKLKGKKVGGYPGSAQQTLIKLMLRQFMSDQDITTVELPPNTQLQALEAGQVDALLTYDETAVLALQNGIAQVLVENPIGKYVVDPCYAFPYVLSAKFVSEHPETARKVRDAMYEAADFIASNDAEARQIMAKWVGVKPEVAQQVNLWEQTKADQIDQVALQKLADIFHDAGVTKKRMDVAGLILKDDELK